jgi:hypothetical protein
MTPPMTSADSDGYTRESVLAYLRTAEAERQRLLQAIGVARARISAARLEADHVGADGMTGAGYRAEPRTVPSLPVEGVDPDPAWTDVALSPDSPEPEPAQPDWSDRAPYDRRRPTDRRMSPREVQWGTPTTPAHAHTVRHGARPAAASRPTAVPGG